jgi:hypothetical protein
MVEPARAPHLLWQFVFAFIKLYRWFKQRIVGKQVTDDVNRVTKTCRLQSITPEMEINTVFPKVQWFLREHTDLKEETNVKQSESPTRGTQSDPAVGTRPVLQAFGSNRSCSVCFYNSCFNFDLKRKYTTRLHTLDTSSVISAQCVGTVWPVLPNYEFFPATDQGSAVSARFCQRLCALCPKFPPLRFDTASGHRWGFVRHAARG